MGAEATSGAAVRESVQPEMPAGEYQKRHEPSADRQASDPHKRSGAHGAAPYQSIAPRSSVWDERGMRRDLRRWSGMNTAALSGGRSRASWTAGPPPRPAVVRDRRPSTRQRAVRGHQLRSVGITSWRCTWQHEVARQAAAAAVTLVTVILLLAVGRPWRYFLDRRAAKLLGDEMTAFEFRSGYYAFTDNLAAIEHLERRLGQIVAGM
jgi:hypothetical protein